ncbi:hypothetical protein PSCICP_50460 [Pseudomonas cichorii]|uniref:Uncharacterized protein n=1 Tax=Pseudomonas cichorii TaxID=36746 RepID=A0ABQ1DVT6_PSECI|nr:hypothetical protein PSCICP_50460 [Pseudomonas cichorii]
MLNDEQARDSLKNLIIKYLKDKDPEADRLTEIVEDRSRQIPIRGVLERMKKLRPPAIYQARARYNRRSFVLVWLVYLFPSAS